MKERNALFTPETQSDFFCCIPTIAKCAFNTSSIVHFSLHEQTQCNWFASTRLVDTVRLRSNWCFSLSAAYVWLEPSQNRPQIKFVACDMLTASSRHESATSKLERRFDIHNQQSLIRGGSTLRSNPILFYIPFLDKIKNPSRIYTLYFPSTNGTPFAFLFQNTASLLSSEMGHFRVLPDLWIKTRLRTQPLILKWFFILIQLKLIFTRKIVHVASFWKWRYLGDGSGLFERV